MPVIRTSDAVPFETHGSRFVSYVSPSRSGSQLCAWRLDVPAGLRGVPHRPTSEEVLLVLHGALEVDIEGERSLVAGGDVVVVPSGSELQVSGGPEGAAVWVTTTAGLQARMADGSIFSPPWAH
jgi:quercetin dioxygenase-like cupin family protein